MQTREIDVRLEFYSELRDLIDATVDTLEVIGDRIETFNESHLESRKIAYELLIAELAAVRFPEGKLREEQS